MSSSIHSMFFIFVFLLCFVVILFCFVFCTLGTLKKESRRRVDQEDGQSLKYMACWYQVKKEGYAGSN